MDNATTQSHSDESLNTRLAGGGGSKGNRPVGGQVRNALLVGGFPGMRDQVAKRLKECGAQLFDHWVELKDVGKRIPEACDVIIYCHTINSHATRQQIMRLNAQRGLPIIYTSHKLAELHKALAAYGYVPGEPLPAMPVLPPSREERTTPLIPVEQVASAPRPSGPRRISMPTAIVAPQAAPAAARPSPRHGRKVGALSKATYPKMDFVRQVLKSNPTIPTIILRQLGQEKLGVPIDSGLIAAIRFREFGVKLQSGGRRARNTAVSLEAAAVLEVKADTTVSGGDMANIAQQESAKDKMEYAHQLVDKRPTMATSVVELLVKKKFGSGTSSANRKAIARYRWKAHGLRGAPGGYVMDRSGKRDLDAEADWKKSLDEYPEGRRPPYPSDRAKKAKAINGHARPSPPDADEDDPPSAGGASPRDQIQRAVKKLRVLMQKLDIDQMVIPLEGKVQARKSVVRMMEF